jgi:hypothetical protein
MRYRDYEDRETRNAEHEEFARRLDDNMSLTSDEIKSGVWMEDKPQWTLEELEAFNQCQQMLEDS